MRTEKNRMPFDNKKFSLTDLMADLTLTLQMDFPNVTMSFDEVLIYGSFRFMHVVDCDGSRSVWNPMVYV